VNNIRVQLKENQILDKNIWKNIPRGIIYLKNLNTEHSKEYEIIKNLSGQLIIDNYKRNPTFGHIRRTTTGYYIERCCYIQGKHTCYWRNDINMNTNEVTLSCNKDCPHTDLKKKKSLKFTLGLLTFSLY